MSNSLGIELEGKIVRIKKSKAGSRKDRRFRVTGGFGASAYTMGTALIGIFLEDGERSRLSGFDVERLEEKS